jgi:hypothetical protein
MFLSLREGGDGTANKQPNPFLPPSIFHAQITHHSLSGKGCHTESMFLMRVLFIRLISNYAVKIT